MSHFRTFQYIYRAEFFFIMNNVFLFVYLFVYYWRTDSESSMNGFPWLFIWTCVVYCLTVLLYCWFGFMQRFMLANRHKTTLSSQSHDVWLFMYESNVQEKREKNAGIFLFFVFICTTPYAIAHNRLCENCTIQIVWCC